MGEKIGTDTWKRGGVLRKCGFKRKALGSKVRLGDCYKKSLAWKRRCNVVVVVVVVYRKPGSRSMIGCWL